MPIRQPAATVIINSLLIVSSSKRALRTKTQRFTRTRTARIVDFRRSRRQDVCAAQEFPRSGCDIMT
jgi:hypothetical protein